MNATLLTNGRILDPASKFDQPAELLIVDGKIADISENREAIDVSGALAACSRLAKH